MILHAFLANPQAVNINYDIIRQIIYYISLTSFIASWFIITFFVVYAITFLLLIMLGYKRNIITNLDKFLLCIVVGFLFIFWNIANMHITTHMIEEYKKLKNL